MIKTRRLVPLLLALTLAAGLGAPAPASAVAPATARQWHAIVGTGAANGHLWLDGYTDGTGDAKFALKGLAATSTYRATFRVGGCSSSGTLLAQLSGLVTDASGAFAATVPVPYADMIRLGGAARTQAVAVRVILGTWVRCASLAFNHATRVYIPSYGINLAVVPGPSGYPYCRVAMYQKVLWQPMEPGVTFIYAHARTGMFLSLLNASKVNNGASMVGKLVYVYTSYSMRYTYKITQVRRHVKTITNVGVIGAEQLWLQTSEGTNYTMPKLVIVAKRIATIHTTYAASHPVARPQVCG